MSNLSRLHSESKSWEAYASKKDDFKKIPSLFDEDVSHEDFTANLKCPFNIKINPHAEIVEKRAFKWAVDFGLFQLDEAAARAPKLEYNRLPALIHSNASQAALELAANWFSWLSLLDDKWDETASGADLQKMREFHLRAEAVLAGDAGAAFEPFTYALYDIVTRFKALSSAETIKRFAENVRLYFKAGRWEASNRRVRLCPSWEIYRGMRSYTGSVLPCFDLFDATDRLRLPREVREHPAIVRLTSLADNVIGWCNDIFSARKEILCNDMHNLIIVLSKARQLSLRKAYEAAVEIHNQDVESFVAQTQSLPRFEKSIDKEVQRYVQCLGRWMRGNFEFSCSAARFAVDSAP